MTDVIINRVPDAIWSDRRINVRLGTRYFYGNTLSTVRSLRTYLEKLRDLEKQVYSKLTFLLHTATYSFPLLTTLICASFWNVKEG